MGGNTVCLQVIFSELCLLLHILDFYSVKTHAPEEMPENSPIGYTHTNTQTRTDVAVLLESCVCDQMCDTPPNRELFVL